MGTEGRVEDEVRRYVGTSEGGEAWVEAWRNAGHEVSLWIEEECWQEGRAGTFAVDALCSLPRPVAAALGRLLIALAEEDAGDAGGRDGG